MKRIKRYFKDTQEMAHVWASQNQADGWSTGRRMFFEGPSIYSYGSHFEIARFVKAGKASIVLFTTRDYSVTTSKHKGVARRAVDGQIVFTVPDVQGDVDSHDKNTLHFIDLIEEGLNKIPRSHTFSGILSGVRSNIQEANSYLRWFGKYVPKGSKAKIKRYFKKIDSLIAPELMEKLTAREVALDARTKKAADARREKWAIMAAGSRAEYEKQEAARIERERLDRENLPADIERWKTGEDVNNQFLYDAPVMLRIKENEIETSRHANVPLIEARKFWHTLRNDGNNKIIGMRLGLYTVDAFDGSTLIVGCHKIPMREVVRMARALAWDTGETLEAVTI